VPDFTLSAACAAPPEEVWKLLHDPARFPEWWAGLDRVERAPGAEEETFYRSAWPDFAYPTRVAARQEGRTIIVSCQVSHVDQEWVLEPDGAGCRVQVRVSYPEAEAARLEQFRQEAAGSLPRLVALAEASAA
jgi:uncharacterized protein YndB with AHSA1/START domain